MTVYRYTYGGKLATTARDTDIYIYVHTRATYVASEPIDPRVSRNEVALRTLANNPTHFRNKKAKSCRRGRLPSRRIFTMKSAGNRRPYTGIYIDVIYGQMDIYINKCSIGTVSKIRWDTVESITYIQALCGEIYI